MIVTEREILEGCYFNEKKEIDFRNLVSVDYQNIYSVRAS